MKIKEIEAFASKTIEDGKNPNLFFVSRNKIGVALMTRYFDVAYNFWKDLPRNEESLLEDRKFGVICSIEPKEENGKELIAIDDSFTFKKHHPNYPKYSKYDY